MTIRRHFAAAGLLAVTAALTSFCAPDMPRAHAFDWVACQAFNIPDPGAWQSACPGWQNQPPDAWTQQLALVNTPGGPASASRIPVEITVVPVIVSLSATSGKPGDTVTITGQHLQGATQVLFQFGSMAANADFTYKSDTMVQAIVPAQPAHTAGPANVRVVAAGGASSSTDQHDFAYSG
jgi:hypothetical protein